MFTSVLVIAGASTGRRLADAGRATRDGVGRRRRAIPRAKPEITLHIVQLICSSTFARCPGPSLPRPGTLNEHQTQLFQPEVRKKYRNCDASSRIGSAGRD